MASTRPTTSIKNGDEEADDMLLNQDPAVLKIFQQLMMALGNEIPESLTNGADQSEDSDMSIQG